MDKSKKYFLLFTVFSLFVLGAVFYSAYLTSESNPAFEGKVPEIITPPEKEYTLLFTGDIMLDRGVKHMTKKHGNGDYSFPFLKIADTLKEADILFGNLESVISDKGHDVGGIYSFRADPASMKGLTFADFDIVTLANNHAFDYTREALEDTMERLQEAGIEYTGAGFNKEEAHSPTTLLLGEDTKVGFLGYTPFLYPYARATEDRSGVTEYSPEKIREDIESAKEKTDILVVTFHYGEEYQKEPNEDQRYISRRAIDWGADIVIGHHPHVTQPVEEYEGGYIAYSLGNFIFDQYFSKETMRGFLLKAKIKGEEITDVEKIHYELNEYYQPEIVR